MKHFKSFVLLAMLFLGISMSSPAQPTTITITNTSVFDVNYVAFTGFGCAPFNSPPIPSGQSIPVILCNPPTLSGNVTVVFDDFTCIPPAGLGASLTLNCGMGTVPYSPCNAFGTSFTLSMRFDCALNTILIMP